MSIGQLETLRQTPANQIKYNVTGETRLEANQRFPQELQRNGYNVELISLPSGHNELSTIHVITNQALHLFALINHTIKMSKVSCHRLHCNHQRKNY